jgi:Arc/MetJ-type ribon-helix-helix transcriptional regulator
LNLIYEEVCAVRTIRQVSGVLPNDIAEAVRTQAGASEVLRDGLRVSMARDQVVEDWLHNQVGPAYDALKADPSCAVTVERVRERLAAEYNRP